MGHKKPQKISAIPWTVSHTELCLGVTASLSTLLLTDFYQLNNLLTNTSKPTASELPDLAFPLLQIVQYHTLLTAVHIVKEYLPNQKHHRHSEYEHGQNVVSALI